MDVTQAELDAFLALADELHFGRTAERLCLSQPRVSRLVSNFETKLGGKLFDRTSRAVRITPLGRRLQERLAPALAEVRAACGQASDEARGRAGLLKVGFTATTEGEVLQHLVRSFEAANPTCQVTLHEVPITDPNSALRDGGVDVLVNWLFVDDPDISTGPAFHREPRCLAIAASHPLARRRSVSVEDLVGLTFARCPGPPTAVLHGLLPATTPSGRPLPRSFVVHTMGEVMAYVASGQIAHATVASLRTTVNRPDIAFVPIRDLPPVPLGLLWCTAHSNARIGALVDHAVGRGNGAPPPGLGGPGDRRGPAGPTRADAPSATVDVDFAVARPTLPADSQDHGR